ncbi:hypothetical protein ACFYV7_12435 [Nocardia suismassiliense]|uniref:Uncharacterized protein n=1 Tax=Nocardia suismassiliense TaxID=2077092 RepID=A0ABW6QQT4_9NOCA
MGNDRRRRVLTVGAQQYRWQTYHQHVDGCEEVLRLRQLGSVAGLTVAFRPDGERTISEGGPSVSGFVWIGDRMLNLHEPGVVRAFIDAAVDAGWLTETRAVGRGNGWDLFDDAYARRHPPASPGLDE